METWMLFQAGDKNNPSICSDGETKSGGQSHNHLMAAPVTRRYREEEWYDRAAHSHTASGSITHREDVTSFSHWFCIIDDHVSICEHPGVWRRGDEGGLARTRTRTPLHLRLSFTHTDQRCYLWAPAAQTHTRQRSGQDTEAFVCTDRWSGNVKGTDGIVAWNNVPAARAHAKTHGCTFTLQI